MAGNDGHLGKDLIHGSEFWTLAKCRHLWKNFGHSGEIRRNLFQWLGWSQYNLEIGSLRGCLYNEEFEKIILTMELVRVIEEMPLMPFLFEGGLINLGFEVYSLFSLLKRREEDIATGNMKYGYMKMWLASTHIMIYEQINQYITIPCTRNKVRAAQGTNLEHLFSFHFLQPYSSRIVLGNKLLRVLTSIHSVLDKPRGSC